MEKRPDPLGRADAQGLALGRLFGLNGRLGHPYWGFIGIWATACGALSSGTLRWNSDGVLLLSLALLLTELAWGSLWDLLTGTDWLHLPSVELPAARISPGRSLPYTLPGSPSGRLSLRLRRFSAWRRHVFWPSTGATVLGVVGAIGLAMILSLLLPSRFRLLSAALVALIGLGIYQRNHGRSPLAGQAVVQVGLGWLAGYAAFADIDSWTVAVAGAFFLAIWGCARVAAGLKGGSWLLHGGQLLAIALVVAMKQPLVAGGMALFYFGTVALQISPFSRIEEGRTRSVDRVGPWLMASMLLTAFAFL